jgi:hypothetical protein
MLACTLLFDASGQGRKKKKDDEERPTQTLPALKDPPPAMTGETARLIFNTSPLSGKGLLSQQVRDALKVLLRDVHGAQIVKIRAFVAGSGDLRRIPQIVSEVFTDHKLNLPAVSTIAVGALAMDNAQVVIESVAVDKKTVNPNGLAFYSARPPSQLQGEFLRMTCFVGSQEEASPIRAKFPSATIVQPQRLGTEPIGLCEAVSRLSDAPAKTLEVRDGVALVHSPQIVFSGIQMAFRDTDSDLRLAFDRVTKSVEGAQIFWRSIYPLTKPVAEKARAFSNGAGTMLLFEGLPSLDATVAVDVMAAK